MKVNFFIIGAPKSGTTSLKQHLSQHSKIVTHKSIECAFFHDESEYNKGEEYLFQKYFFNQKEYNNDCFGLVKQSSAFYYNDTIKRALDYDSEIQFILVCRNPIERYISSYFMEVERSAYSKSIEESIELAFNDKNSWEYKGLNMYGKYDRVIDNLFKIIPLQNFHIVLFEDLKKSPEVVLSCLQSKLNIESQLLDLYQYKAVNAYKVSQSKLLTTIYNKVKRSNSVKRLKKHIPAKYVYLINQFYKKINQKDVVGKPKVCSEVYEILYNNYKESIIRFEKQNEITTNWLSR